MKICVVGAGPDLKLTAANRNVLLGNNHLYAQFSFCREQTQNVRSCFHSPLLATLLPCALFPSTFGTVQHLVLIRKAMGIKSIACAPRTELYKRHQSMYPAPSFFPKAGLVLRNSFKENWMDEGKRTV